jgi:tol-pal system protein YbgF
MRPGEVQGQKQGRHNFAMFPPDFDTRILNFVFWILYSGAALRHEIMKASKILNCRIPAAAFAVIVALGPVALAPVPAGAQNTGMQELLNRVERLQREISTLQRQVYKGEAPPAATAPTSLAGRPASDPRSAGRNSIRLSQLEGELQRLTGRIEQIDFLTQQINTRLEKLISDMDQRLTALEGGTPASSAAINGGVQPVNPQPNVGLPLRPPPAARLPAAPQAVTAPVLRPPPTANAARGTAPGVLGTIPKNLAVSTPRGPAAVTPLPPRPAASSVPSPAVAAAAPPAAILPAGTPKKQYDYALSLMLKQQDFAKAETALKAFIEQNPKDKLTGNAYYWLGETYYVRKSYQDAAFSFAEGFQTFPKNNKAPDSLLKLGMSLERLKKRKEACTAYSRLLSTFPKAAPRLKARVQREQRQAKCR